MVALRRFASLLALAAMATLGSAQQYLVHMDGLTESPPNASPGHGMGIIDINVGAMTMGINVAFSDLIGNTTAAHIHAATVNPGTGTAGVATQTPSFSGFPLGVTAGVHVQSYDMSLATSWNATYINNNGGTTATAWAASTTAIAQGRAY